MKILIVIAAVVAGLYWEYQTYFPSATVRYKLTLTVDVNGKQVTGSSVVEVYRQDTTKVFGGSFGGYGYDFRGEAVAVDLGEKGVLFALLKAGSSSDSQPPYIIKYLGNYSLDPVENLRKMKQARPRPKVDLSFDKIPMLVRFRDINDPKTVELVDPNDLEKSFGKGVKLVSATLEMTDEDVTRGVEKWLPWIREYYGKRLDGDHSGAYAPFDAINNLANGLSSGNFSANIGLSKYE